jgi:hypothetical protein
VRAAGPAWAAMRWSVPSLARCSTCLHPLRGHRPHRATL